MSAICSAGNVSIDHKVPGSLILIYIELQSRGTRNSETGKLERRKPVCPKSDCHSPFLPPTPLSLDLVIILTSTGFKT